MNVWLQGLLAGTALAAVLIIFEYLAIGREVAERSRKVARKVEWDSNQKSRMRGMISFGAILPIGGAIGFWLLSKM
jgi:hypothetical protein